VIPKRKCDLVMKGGITSGVVYAGAIAELGRAFRFKSIGGTSAGAIGAAVAAAAEYARACDRQPGMTARLQLLIEDLTTPDYFAGLLQPFRAGRPVLAALLALLRQQRRPAVRIMAALWHVVLARWWWPVLAAAGAGVVIWALLRDAALSTPWTAVLIALIVLLAVLAGLGLPVLLLARAAWKGLAAPENRLGLCSGISTGSRPALTDWLHTTIQRTAGLPEYKPLTFRRLGKKGIELAMITTELASARPLRLPLETEGAYWYDSHELRGLFPSTVCDYMDRVAGPAGAHGLRPLPADRLPVIVALRMSLSVPLLLACVPLYAAPSRDRRCWFTDGGVTSNFPIHFFDAWLPKRPTFGLDLVPVGSRDVDRIHLPGLDDPPAARWENVDGPAGLLRQIADAAQNWRDTAQAELPGFRDRICQVRLYPGEGGLHINMPAGGVQQLIEAGRAAGRAFVGHFDERRMLGHRVRRYLVLTDQLQENLDMVAGRFDDLEPRLGDGLPGDPAYRPPFEAETRKATRRLLKAADKARQPDSPPAAPPPALRIGPKT
jgi:predicted acylesterase/phospholipase RssA